MPSLSSTIKEYVDLLPASGRVPEVRSGSVKGLGLAVTGNIGTGKTSLSRKCAEYAIENNIDCHLFEEDITEEMLGQFENDRKTYSYPFQMVMATKAQILTNSAMLLNKRGVFTICDRTPVDNVCFEALHLVSGNLTEQEHEVYRAEWIMHLPYTYHCLMHIRTTLPNTMHRIKTRGRKAEQSLTEEYIADLDRAHLMLFFGLIEKGHTNVMLVDWNEDAMFNTAPEKILRECVSYVQEPALHAYSYRGGTQWLERATNEERDRAFEHLCTRKQLVI